MKVEVLRTDSQDKCVVCAQWPKLRSAEGESDVHAEVEPIINGKKFKPKSRRGEKAQKQN